MSKLRDERAPYGFLIAAKMNLNTKSPWPLNCLTVLVILMSLVSGCAHYPINAPLTAVSPRTGYRFQNVAAQTNSDELALMLSFSGGGTRAAALYYGVLEALKNTKVGPPGNQLESPCRSAVSQRQCYGSWFGRAV